MDLKELQVQQNRVATERRQGAEIKKLRKDHDDQYTSEVKKNERIMSKMTKDYETKISHLEGELESKLKVVRQKHQQQMQFENTRLSDEVTNLKLAHGSQVGELKNSQAVELENLIEGHKNSLENARNKYKKEQLKVET